MHATSQSRSATFVMLCTWEMFPDMWKTHCKHFHSFPFPAMAPTPIASALQPIRKKKCRPRRINPEWLIQFGLLVTARDTVASKPSPFTSAFAMPSVVERSCLGPRKKCQLPLASHGGEELRDSARITSPHTFPHSTDRADRYLTDGYPLLYCRRCIEVNASWYWEQCMFYRRTVHFQRLWNMFWPAYL